MIIDGINTSTYGLKVAAMSNPFSQPARKKVLPEPGFEGKDIVFTEKNIKLELFGEYGSLASLYLNVEGFKTLLKSSRVHTFVRASHALSVSAVVDGPVKIEDDKKVVTVKFQINIVE